MSVHVQWTLAIEKPTFSTFVYETGAVAIRQDIPGQSLAVYGSPDELQGWLDELVAVTQLAIDEAKARNADRAVVGS